MCTLWFPAYGIQDIHTDLVKMVVIPFFLYVISKNELRARVGLLH